MAPGRKKGANKERRGNQLSVGDLVLAKVKGFPFWPAKISRPEDWERAPDPKKVFVEFFGTQEIAFVASTDVQLFTHESKSKLAARCQGKTKFFSQAVEEICKSFDQLHDEKPSSFEDDSDRQCHRGKVSLADQSEEDDDVAEDKLGVRVGVAGTGKNKRKVPNHAQLPETSSDTSGSPPCGKHEESGCGGKEIRSTKKSTEAVMASTNVHKPIASTSAKKLDSAAQLDCSQKGTRPAPGISSHRKQRELASTNMSMKKRLKNVSMGADVSMGGSNSETVDDKLSPSIGQREIVCATRAKCDIRESDFSAKKGKDFQSERLETATSAPCDISMVQCEAVTRSSKRRKVTSDVACSAAATNSSDARERKPRLNNVKAHKRRRAVILYDDDSNDEPKTPVHGDSATDAKSLPEVVSAVNGMNTELGVADSMEPECGISKELSSELPQPSSSATLSETKNLDSVVSPASGEIEVAKSPPVAGKLDAIKAPSKIRVSTASELAVEEQMTKKPLVSKKVLTSPNCAFSKASEKHLKETKSSVPGELESKSMQMPCESEPDLTPSQTSPGELPPKPFVEHDKGMKPLVKNHGLSGSRGAHGGSILVSCSMSHGSNAAAAHGLSDRNKSAACGGRQTSISKANLKIGEAALTVESSIEHKSLFCAIQETPRDGKSMKHLIAAAQAKRRQAHSQTFSPANSNFDFLANHEVQWKSPVSSDHIPASQSGKPIEADLLGLNHHPDLLSMSMFGPQLVDSENKVEGRASSGHRAVGGSLSGGTEAAVARDAFEGMIETLSRTKESIGRATRLAIDCAKYGIANEVVELLIRKLECESSFHRKVDLFFLMDSITQCSHNQKGIAGASYIPAVQAALPRLLGAAAPSGASARENRRQCLKVLRLWIQRKILPESLLRHYMDDIVVSNDDSSAGFSFKHPSRTERAVDDPLREMDGMLVDEYGSNATFQLPGLFPSHIFEDDEDDLPSTSPMEDSGIFSARPVCGAQESDVNWTTPNDRRNCTLLDVDGELEMEDVSCYQNGVMANYPRGALEAHQQGHSKGLLEHAVGNSAGLSPISEGLPPLPPGSPPSLPPLPTSPPLAPPPPPPLSPSSSPPPLPPSPPSIQPPPPPLPPPIPHQATPLSFGPPSSMPPQPPFLPQSAYQSVVPHEYHNMQNGGQIMSMAGNFHGSHGACLTKSDAYPQQNSSFPPLSVCNSGEPSDYSALRPCGNGGMYYNAESSRQNQYFQPANAAFGPRFSHPNMSHVSRHFSFSGPAVQQHPPHSYPCPGPMPSRSDAQKEPMPGEKWMFPSSDFNTDQYSAQVSGRQDSLQARPLFNQQGIC